MPNEAFSPLGMIIAHNRGLRGSQLLLAGVLSAQFPDPTIGLLVADRFARSRAPRDDTSATAVLVQSEDQQKPDRAGDTAESKEKPSGKKC